MWLRVSSLQGHHPANISTFKKIKIYKFGNYLSFTTRRDPENTPGPNFYKLCPMFPMQVSNIILNRIKTDLKK